MDLELRYTININEPFISSPVPIAIQERLDGADIRNNSVPLSNAAVNEKLKLVLSSPDIKVEKFLLIGSTDLDRACSPKDELEAIVGCTKGGLSKNSVYRETTYGDKSKQPSSNPMIGTCLGLAER